MMARAAAKQVATVDDTVSRDVVMAKYETMILTIPEGGDADGFGLIADVINAKSWDDLNGDGKLQKAEDVAGCEIKVLSLTRHRSEIEGGMPWYLIARYVDTATGEVGSFNTSAGVVMAKLVSLHCLRVLPALVKIEKATKATRGGFFPLDMVVLAATPPGSES